jgi:predicted peroxiredoxin
MIIIVWSTQNDNEMKKFSLLILTLIMAGSLFSQNQNSNDKKMKILIHITQGPENPTRAALAFLVAKSAIEEGHTVVIFLAGDGVQLFRAEVLDNLAGLGTGKLREHYDAIVNGGAKFYLSGVSSKVRGITEDKIKSTQAEFALPNVLVRLAVECDRVFVY